MYAIIETGGKQYRVKEGDLLDVELLRSGRSALIFDKVLLVHDGKGPKIGLPYVSDCTVHAEFVSEVRGPKTIAYKFKPCKNSRRTVGHRQCYFRVKITKIAAG